MLTSTLVALCALLHLWFMILEMVLWTHPIGLKTFGRTLEQQQQSAVLAANQGLYNGFLAAGLLWSLVPGQPLAASLQTFFLGCVTVAGLFGGATVSRRIALVQAGPALFGLLALWKGL